MDLCKKKLIDERKEKDKKLVDLYRKFLEIRYYEPMEGNPAEYDWFSFPKNLSFDSQIYHEMLSEHARELSNSINDLRQYIINLKTWMKITENIEVQLKFELLDEMIIPFATLAINLIYVIRSRFFFSVAHLCHQANIIKFRKDGKVFDINLPKDKDIWQKDADKMGAYWKDYKKLKLALEKVCSQKFTKATGDFRNKYNHRYPQNIGIGYTRAVRRRIEDKKIIYSKLHIEPLSLESLTPLLVEQYLLISDSYARYQQLVFSHLSM
jgi:hypothetical protein